MSAKQLITLAVIAGALAVFLIIQQLGKVTPDIEDELSLVALAPQGFLASDVSRIEIYRGSKKDDKVTLAKKEDDTWIIESKYGAPGKKTKIEDFLKKMKGLEGELRSESPDVLEDFNITGEKALHIAVFKKDQEAPWYHLLLGKKETYNRSFVRRAEDDIVYTVDVNLLSELGIWGDDVDKTPEAKEWLDKTILDLDKDKVIRIALGTPDRALAFEKREKKKEEGEETKETGGGKENKKEFEWVLAEGGPGTEFKQSGLDDILGTLASFEAEDVEDPAKKNELGLDRPNFRCAVALEGGKETNLLAYREKPGEDVFVMLEGRDFIFKVPEWKFDDLFKRGKDLFDLPGLDEEDNKIQAITLTYSDFEIELKKADDDWTLEAPQTGIEFKESEAGNIARELASWKPVDFADSTDLAQFGLDKPSFKAVFTLEDGRKHAILLGDESRGIEEGRYALLNDNQRVLVAEKWTIGRIFPEAKEFFELKVADIDKADITKVAVEQKENPFVLEKKDGKWTLSSGGEALEPDDSRINDYLDRFEKLEAENLILTGKPTDAEHEATVIIERRDKEPLTLTLLGEKEGKRAVLVSGVRVPLLFTKDKIAELTPSLNYLAKPEAVDEPETQPEEKTDKASKEPTEEPSAETPEAETLEPTGETTPSAAE